MDWKYLNDRYTTGLSRVREFMGKKVQTQAISTLILSHASIVQAQADMGPNGLLDNFVYCIVV